MSPAIIHDWKLVMDVNFHTGIVGEKLLLSNLAHFRLGS